MQIIVASYNRLTQATRACVKGRKCQLEYHGTSLYMLLLGERRDRVSIQDGLAVFDSSLG